ncbi:MAG: DUF2070 family protein [Candidatus Micrarchaeota archaeon]
MDIDVDQKAVNLTYFLFKTPSYRKTTAWLLIVSFIFGVIARLASGKLETLLETFLYGGTDGILVLAAPAVVSALLATFFVSRKQFKQGFKYFSFLSLAGSVLFALVLLFGLLIGNKVFQSTNIEMYAIIGSALVLVLWLISTWIALAYKKKAIFLCVLHPLANLAFITLWNKFAIIESSVAFSNSPVLAVFKLAIASIILLIAITALVFIINAPTKRNFGISTIDTITMFFAQWVSGNKGLEDILASNSETITTQVGVVTFKHGKNIKATFLVPQLHYGPIGNLGGSEFPALLSTSLAKATSAPVFVFKGTANHDFNPVYSSDVKKIETASLQGISESGKSQTNNAAFIEGRKGYSHVYGFDVNNVAFLTLSRQPQNCEDIHQALGRSLHNKVLSCGYKEAILVDRHHCKVDGSLIEIGSKEYVDYEKAIGEEMHRSPGKIAMGVSQSTHAFKMEDGIGGGGLKTAVFQIGKHKACFVVVDANNCLPEFRKAIVEAAGKKHKFDFIDVFTTDSHAVNTISGVHNPLGARLDKIVFLREVEKIVDKAFSNLTPVTAGASVKDVEIEVLGQQRSSELVITVNSIFAILKILAPVIFIGSIILAFLALITIT